MKRVFLRMCDVRLLWLAITALFAVAACGPGDNGTTDASQHEATVIVRDSAGRAQARAIYERACARCHDPGASAAPSIGVREDWDGRSRMWLAVLAEHVRLGYLEMPARGGSATLTDVQVVAATEYIMAVTYPELPLD